MLLYLVVLLGFLMATNGVVLGACGRGFENSDKFPYGCVDIDECAVSKPCQQKCINSKGSYECYCNPGYQINERDPTKCDDPETSCQKGFKPDPRNPASCIDIDECAVSKPCQQKCKNSKGSYECYCNSGYQINERDPTKCDNPAETSCPKGFKPNPINPASCIDIDECEVNPPCQQKCKNSKGSYECYCNSGYQINERDPTKCDIINNCQSGYTPNLLDPTQCLDVDECSDRPCEHTCTNTEGSFRCSCRDGFAVDPNNKNKCTDVDECSGSKPCEQTCTNTAGGYVCSCRSGFTISATNSAKCESVDKCSNRPCEQNCKSTDSGYQCSCKQGYVVSRSDPTKCEDVDECSDSPCEHTCTNTQGSFRCSCRDGFAVDSNNKNKCTGVDACSTGRRCEHICTIISTGRKCSCKAGYVINEEDNTLCDEVEVCKTKADVILVFDASSSIGVDHFDKQFVFAKRLTSNFKLGINDVRFGGIVYSRFAEKLFDLKDHSTLETLNKALSNVNYMDSSTYTHEAFLLIDKQQLFSVDKGGRRDAPDIVVLFTDGNPTFEDKAIDSAQKLKDSGVLILGVAIGPALDLSVLKRITSTPSDALEASSYDTLDYIEKRLTQLLCDVSKSSKRIA